MTQLLPTLPEMPVTVVIRPERCGPTEILCPVCRRFRVRTAEVVEAWQQIGLCGTATVSVVTRGSERWECWTCWTAVDLRFGRTEGETC